ncbi:MAG: tetratricopeptide repeat protein [Faecalibacterium sp.]
MEEETVLDLHHPDYENIRVLNRLGGTGDLFVAHKKGMDIDVVIKRTQLQYVHLLNQERESSILKNLKHQYLPRIYDVIYGKDQCIYTVMDLISGQNLQQYVEKNGPIHQKECYHWACQLCEVVQYLHQDTKEKPAILHCDIKPGNIMITESGDICLIDFNTSLIFQENMAAVGVTDGYAAPEQYGTAQQNASGRRNAALSRQVVPASGEETSLMEGVAVPEETMLMESEHSPLTETAVMETGICMDNTASPAKAEKPEYRTISKATDIYAIGATLYFAVTGHRPECSRQEVTPLAQYKPQISLSMQTIIGRAMQKQPSMRFQQASEMLRALKDIDQMDQSYRQYRLRKRITYAALVAAFAISFCSFLYGIEKMKTDRENKYLLALSQAEQKAENMEYSEAQLLLEGAMQLQPERVDAYWKLAALMYRKGDYQGAIDLLESAFSSGNLSEKNLDSASREKVYYILGNCYLELGDYQQAVPQLEKAVTIQGASTDSYRSLAIALANAGKMDDAQDTLETMRAQHAAVSDCDLVAAELAFLKHEYEKSLSLYEKVFDEVTNEQLLEHAYLSAANAALESGAEIRAIKILEQSRERLSEERNVLQTEMLADIYIQKAVSEKEDASGYYHSAKELLEELVSRGYATISTRLNLATVLQALDLYAQANDVLDDLAAEYPTDYRFDMQKAYLLIDWQGTLPIDQRNYQEAKKTYDSAAEKYALAKANGMEDAQMSVLQSLIHQLESQGWLR